MCVELTAPRVDVRSIRELFGCDVVLGRSSAAVVFASSCLAAPNRSVAEDERATRSEVPSTPSGAVPPPSDLVRVVEHLVLLGLLDGQRTQRAACRRLGVSVRTLQRRLAEHGATFEQMLASVMLRQATAWLQSPRTITEIALDFGYSDPAHFTRAFARWTGMSPSAWRRRRFASSVIR